MRFPLSLTILLMLLLSGCFDDSPAIPSSKAAEAARIEREVARRVEAARLESAVRSNRLRTIRVLGFIGLAGGAVAGLVWLKSRRVPDLTARPYRHHGNRPPLWDDHYPAGNGRVIDSPAQPLHPPPPRNLHETPPRP